LKVAEPRFEARVRDLRKCSRKLRCDEPDGKAPKEWYHGEADDAVQWPSSPHKALELPARCFSEDAHTHLQMKLWVLACRTSVPIGPPATLKKSSAVSAETPRDRAWRSFSFCPARHTDPARSVSAVVRN
jgi:hypothetical protein